MKSSKTMADLSLPDSLSPFLKQFLITLRPLLLQQRTSPTLSSSYTSSIELTDDVPCVPPLTLILLSILGFHYPNRTKEERETR